jgi:hypothetical protein
MPVPPVCQGRIVWVDVPGRDGKLKRRPVVITASSAEIASGDDLAGIVCSHSSASVHPRPSDYEELPHDPSGVCRTKLRKPTVAICRWRARISQTQLARLDAQDFGGVVQPRLVETMIKKSLDYPGNPNA